MNRFLAVDPIRDSRKTRYAADFIVLHFERHERDGIAVAKYRATLRMGARQAGGNSRG